jgi:hypothetical protein
VYLESLELKRKMNFSALAQAHTREERKIVNKTSDKTTAAKMKY